MDRVVDVGAVGDFSELLEQVEHGESFVITRDGRAVAELKPASDADRDLAVTRAQEAAARIRALAKDLKLGPFNWDEWKAYRDEGRM